MNDEEIVTSVMIKVMGAHGVAEKLCEECDMTWAQAVRWVDMVQIKMEAIRRMPFDFIKINQQKGVTA